MLPRQKPSKRKAVLLNGFIRDAKRSEGSYDDLIEGDIEQMALQELRGLGWEVAYGPDIAWDGS